MKKLLLILLLVLSIKINAQWVALGNSFTSTPSTAQINTLLIQKNTGNIFAAGELVSPSSSGTTLFQFSNSQWSAALNANNLNVFGANLYSLGTIYDMCQDNSGNIFLGSNSSIYLQGGGPISHYIPIIEYDGNTGTISGPDATTQCATAPISSIKIKHNSGSNNYYLYAAGLFSNEYNKKTIVYSNQYGVFGANCGYNEIRGIDSTENLTQLCITKQDSIIATGRIKNSLGKYIVAIGNGGVYWKELGGINTSMFNNEILSLEINEYSAQNNIYAVGKFTNTAGNRYVAKWDGSSWTELGGTNSLAANGDIYSICFDGNNNVYVAGDFTNSAGNRYVAKWDGSSWSELGGSNGLSANNTILKVIADSLGNVYTAGRFTDINNKLYVAKYTSILPLKLLSFTAKQQQNKVLLNWQTATEENVSHINIQRSINNKEFNTIGHVNAKCCSYNFTDNLIPNTQYPALYYKLEIVDKDGSKTYSSIQKVTINSVPTALRVYPNPSQGNITIEAKDINTIEIIDYLGRKIKEQAIQPQATVLNYQLPKGVYFIKATMKAGGFKTEKIVVE